MSLKYVYFIRWYCDGSEEIYDTKDERSGRINTLENQGYEKDKDFWIGLHILTEDEWLRGV